MHIFTARLEPFIDRPWTLMAPIYTGATPSWLGTPAIYCLVEQDGNPFMRLDVYGKYSCGPFTEAHIWHKWVVIGIEESVHLVSLDGQERHSYDVDDYFGHLHPTNDHLFIASARNVLCLDREARLLWVSGELGIDGVIIQSIGQNEILGEGEWDPPNGWRPFKLSRSSGLKIAE